MNTKTESRKASSLLIKSIFVFGLLALAFSMHSCEDKLIAPDTDDNLGGSGGSAGSGGSGTGSEGVLEMFWHAIVKRIYFENTEFSHEKIDRWI